MVEWVLAIELCSPWLSRLTLESLLSYFACQRTSTHGGPTENLYRYVDHPQISLGWELIPLTDIVGGGFLRINIGATILSAALHSLYIFHLYVLITSLFLVLILVLGLFSFLYLFLGWGKRRWLVGFVLRFTGVVYDLRYHVAFDGMIR